jgi:transcription antitermination factor NusG
MTQRKNNAWYVIKTHARAEKKVAERLTASGFHVYLPLQKTVKIWSDRKKKVEQPLIASTLFVYTTAEALNGVYTCQGVHSVLRFLGKPAVVQEHEIENLRILLQETHDKTLQATDRLQQGDPVRVIRGPFQGLLATAVETAQRFRVVVELPTLGTGFVVNVPKSYVRKEELKRAV